MMEIYNITKSVLPSVSGVLNFAWVHTGKYVLKNTETGMRRRVHLHRRDPDAVMTPPARALRQTEPEPRNNGGDEYRPRVDKGKIVYPGNEPLTFQKKIEQEGEQIEDPPREPLVRIMLSPPCDADALPTGEQNVVVPLELVSIARTASMFRVRNSNLLQSVKTKLLAATRDYVITEDERHKYVALSAAYGIVPSEYELAALQHLESADSRQKCQIANKIISGKAGDLVYSEEPIDKLDPLSWQFQSMVGETTTGILSPE